MKALIGILSAVLVVICIILVMSEGFNIYSIVGLLFIVITFLGAFVGGSGKKKGDGDNSNDNNQSDNNEPKN